MGPDLAWKESQRSIVLNQINAGSIELGRAYSFRDLFMIPLNTVQNFSQPILATFVVVFLFLTGGVFSLRASQNAKPGDSLYVAKIVGEKTQLALTFSDKKKAQLGLIFAANRATEIKQVIAEDGEGVVKEDKVEKLVSDYKKEITAAKQRIGKITEATKGAMLSNPNTNQEVDVNDVNRELNGDGSDTGDAGEAPGQIFSAGSSKSNNGLVVSGGTATTNETDANNTGTSPKANPAEVKKSSSTEENLAPKKESPESILEQASKLLNADSFDEAFDKLDQVGTAIDSTFKKGEVRGVEESVGEMGTSTKN